MKVSNSSVLLKFGKIKDKYGFFPSLLLGIGKITYRFFISFFIKICRFLIKINKNAILLYSVPDFAENSKAIYEFLIRNGYHLKYDIFWIVEEPNKYIEHETNATFLKRYNVFRELPLKSIYYHMKVQYVMTTHGFHIPRRKSNKGQVYIELFHGSGYKASEVEGNPIINFDYHIVSGPLFVKKMSEFWHTDNHKLFLPTGFPRYDWLLQDSPKAEKLIKHIKGNNNKIIIWMPTFRKTGSDYFKEGLINSFPLVKNDEEWKRLDHFCAEKGLILIIKLHILQTNYNIDFTKYSNILTISNQELEKEGVDLYRFIKYTDALISDYSSIAIDYLVLNKPIAFALDDFDMYKKLRGFVFNNPLDFMPGHHVYNFEDLVLFLADIADNQDPFINKRNVIKRVAIKESNHYCFDVLNKIGIK